MFQCLLSKRLEGSTTVPKKNKSASSKSLIRVKIKNRKSLLSLNFAKHSEIWKVYCCTHMRRHLANDIYAY